MRSSLRRIAVVLIALAFLAGGFVRPMMALAPAQPCHEHHQAVHSADDHAMHSAHAGHRQIDESEHSAPAAGACFKCCGICTIAPNLIDPAAHAVARLISYSVAYFVATKTYADRPLAIDPGIPKRIA